MSEVIRNSGDPNHAKTLQGLPVQREKQIWIPSHNRYVPVLQTSMHFCYRDPSVVRGSTLFCTCGSPAVIVGYEAYRSLTSFIDNEVLVCYHYIQYKVHSDGSHE